MRTIATAYEHARLRANPAVARDSHAGHRAQDVSDDRGLLGFERFQINNGDGLANFGARLGNAIGGDDDGVIIRCKRSHRQQHKCRRCIFQNCHWILLCVTFNQMPSREENSPVRASLPAGTKDQL